MLPSSFHTGGNAGLAAAYACNKLGLPATIVVPEQTLKCVIQRLEGQEAEVVVMGKVINWVTVSDCVIYKSYFTCLF